MRLVLALLVAMFVATSVHAADVAIEGQYTRVLEKKMESNVGDLELEYDELILSLPIELNEKVTVAPLVGVLSNATVNEDGIDDSLVAGLGIDVGLLSNDILDLDLISALKVSDLEDEAGGDIGYKEYSTELRVSKVLETADYTLTPYAGIRLSDTDIDVDLDLVDASQEENVGITCGVDVAVLDNLVISVSGNFVDQESFGVSGKLKF